MRRNFLKQSLLAADTASVPAGNLLTREKMEKKRLKYDLPYENTYLKEPFVTESEFRTAKPETITPGTFEEARQILPDPTWSGHEKEIEIYRKTWQIGIGNIKVPEPDSGFVCSYLDVAYNDGIFTWDSAFMIMFTRFGTRFFPFQRTLDSFYAKQHPDGFTCWEVRADGADCFKRYDPTSTGSNTLPWSEIVYYKQFSNIDYLHKIFPALCAYYKWLRLNHTWRNGTYWTCGWGTDMSNMPRVEPKYNPVYDHGHMVWLDVCLQQCFTAGHLLEMGFYLERWQEIKEFEDGQKILEEYINENLWDEKEHFLFGQYADESLSPARGVYAYWALLTDVLSKERMDALVVELDNKKTFNRLHRVPSFAVSHPEYKDNGHYQQDSAQPGADYMVITSLLQQDYRKSAYEVARNHYDNVLKVCKNTGALWRYYTPEHEEPGFMARPNFVDWSGLASISGSIGQIFGIHFNMYEKKLTVDVNLTEAYGIDRYPFGLDSLVAIKVKSRSSTTQEPQVEITSDIPLELTVLWDDKQKTANIKPDTQAV